MTRFQAELGFSSQNMAQPRRRDPLSAAPARIAIFDLPSCCNGGWQGKPPMTTLRYLCQSIGATLHVRGVEMHAARSVP